MLYQHVEHVQRFSPRPLAARKVAVCRLYLVTQRMMLMYFHNENMQIIRDLETTAKDLSLETTPVLSSPDMCWRVEPFLPKMWYAVACRGLALCVPSWTI
jgi:hypothetical protein